MVIAPRPPASPSSIVRPSRRPRIRGGGTPSSPAHAVLRTTAARRPGPIRVLGYQNTATNLADGPNAMLLHLPTHRFDNARAAQAKPPLMRYPPPEPDLLTCSPAHLLTCSPAHLLTLPALDCHTGGCPTSTPPSPWTIG
ncbi:hypothetical protein OG235_20855 [Streptomyces sp. NBC_00024]|uniref:hypothetical protein n=1 Tax=Streptomyces sp. NBC_00024 TaxID=2903612 RepID=UPI003247F99F